MNMKNIAYSTKQAANRLRHYDEARGRRVVGVFQVGAIMCCELDGGFLVGGQIAEEHNNVEIVLGLISELPPMFGPAMRAPHPMQLLLVGRMFRGFVTCSKSGDVSLVFGRYVIRFVRQDSMAVLEIGTDRPESRDLPEDSHLSIDAQLKHFQEIAGGNPRFC